MVNSFDYRPAPDVVAHLVVDLWRDRVNALSHIEDACIDAGVLDSAKVVDPSLVFFRRPRGDISSLARSLQFAVHGNRIDTIRESFRVFRSLVDSDDLSGDLVLKWTAPSWVTETFDAEAKVSVGPKATIVCSSDEDPFTIDCFNQATSHLREILPELWAEILHLVSQVLVFDSETVNAGSTWHAFGTVFLRRLEPQSETWTAVFEHLVHESAHHSLFALSTRYPLVVDNSPDIYSPFRGINRPAEAVFHALFVMLRIMYASTVVRAHLGHYKATAKYYFARTRPMAEEFLENAEAMLAADVLTPVSSQIVSEGIKWVRQTKGIPV